MAEHVLFVGWNRPLAGREKVCSELFATALGFWASQKEQGNIESFEPVLLTVHGGDLNGFILVRGDRAKLDTVRSSDAFLDLMTQININAQGLGILGGWTGDGAAKQMARYQKALK